MSWIFGIIKSGKIASSGRDYSKLLPQALLKVSSTDMYMALGGIPETCVFETQGEHQESGWAVVGLGLHAEQSGSRLLTKSDWSRDMVQSTPSIDLLNGHFVAVRWSKDSVELFTDQLGLRTVYYAPCEEGVCFSTREDWIARKTGFSELNKATLGTRWMLFNQLSYEASVKEIKRLGPSGHVVIKQGNVTKHESRPWLPEFGCQNGDKAKQVLMSLIGDLADSDQPISLSLSGGFDSRTVLAILMGKKDARFGVHTFGEPSDPDVRVAESIARHYNLKYQYFNDPLPGPEDSIALIRSFGAQNILVEPVSSALRLRYYERLHANGCIVIDGGLGELGRRQYLNRIVKLGRSILIEGDADKLFNFLRTPRADIFTKEYAKTIESAALQSLGETLKLMPSVSEIGVENFVDLFSVRTRVPNFGGPEQTRSDAYVQNFMPLVQPSFLRSAFQTDLRWRNNGKFYKEIMRDSEPGLMNFPLVKSGTTYPFCLSTPAAWAYTKLKNKIAKSYKDNAPDRLLFNLKEFVLDLIASREVKQWEGYDYTNVSQTIERYYKGEKHLRKTVDWWLTFELWKQSFKN